MFTFTFDDLLSEQSTRRPGHPAVTLGGNTVSYEELGQRVDVAAAWLHAQGIGRGDRVGVHLHKSVEEIVAMFAAARLGAVFVNVNFQWTLHQLQYVIQDCRMQCLFTDQRRAGEMQRAGLLDAVEHVVVKGRPPAHTKAVAWSELPESDGPPARGPIDSDLAALLYTSGSTGSPKGVMLTHANLVLGARSVARYLKNHDDDRVLSVLPFSFDYGLSQLTTMFLVGGTVVLQPVVMPVEIVRTAVAQRVTGIAAVPPLWIQLVRFLEEQPEAFDNLRYITNSGGKIPGPILDSLPRVFPATEIYLMYGLTEAFRSTFLPPELFEKKKGAIGQAIPNVEIFVVDPEKGICGPGEQGELVHRGSLISQGYYGQPEATAERIRPSAHLKPLIGDEDVLFSGDLVRLDEDGCLWFVSRMDSLIKCSGFRISPTEVEDIVHQSRLVAEVVAFGVDDEMLGQAVHVAVGTHDNAGADIESLSEHCHKHMPTYMVPQKIHVWQGQMPRTGSGKIDRPAVINDCLARG